MGKDLLVQWNTWMYCQYRHIDNDNYDDEMVMTNNDEDNSGSVDGGAFLLLLHSDDQEL